jgi:hypothetical protein
MRAMDVPQIIDELTHTKGLPRAALSAATERRAEVVPVFLQEIERYLAADAEGRKAPTPLFFAFHLLGQWREHAAYRPLARLLRCRTDDLEHLFDDALTETAHRVMAAVFDGDPQPLYGVILERDADEFARSRMFDALVMLVLQGRVPRGELARFLRECFDTLQPQDTCYVWSGWQEAVATLGLAELEGLVRRAFAREFIAPDWCNFDDFAGDLAHALAYPEDPYVRGGGERTLFGDAIEEFSTWYGFSEQYERDRAEARRRAAERRVASGTPIVNPWRRVGRNDPCPCGSGRKFKRCCVAVGAAAVAAGA